MIKIAHRGNLFGRIPERENSPEYIQEALAAGYDVEVDVWFEEGKLFLGHAKPQYEVIIFGVTQKTRLPYLKCFKIKK